MIKNVAIALVLVGIVGILLSGCKVNEQNTVMEKIADENAMMTTDNTAMTQTDENMMEKTADENSMMDESAASDDAMMKDESMKSYQGSVLADKSASKYLAFTQKDYDQAIMEGTIIVLDFYASWCPDCKAEQPVIIEAFNELDQENVIGFRVNYKDSDTDSTETELAREFGISYQHTKVIIKEGVRILKSPEVWNKDRYLSEMRSVL